MSEEPTADEIKAFLLYTEAVFKKLCATRVENEFFQKVKDLPLIKIIIPVDRICVSATVNKNGVKLE